MAKHAKSTLKQNAITPFAKYDHPSTWKKKKKKKTGVLSYNVAVSCYGLLTIPGSVFIMIYFDFFVWLAMVSFVK